MSSINDMQICFFSLTISISCEERQGVREFPNNIKGLWNLAFLSDIGALEEGSFRALSDPCDPLLRYDLGYTRTYPMYF